jgi:Na+/H+-translocating membrane pyrophosphatase
MTTRALFSFPNPVNELSARLVAAGVVLMSLATIVFDQPWLTAVIAYGFVARVLTGPTLSPLGQLVTRVITPRLPVAAKPVAGPPKRFAQGMGAVMSVSAAVLALGFGERSAAYLVLGFLTAAATLESVFAYCLGCRIFAVLMRVGVIPAEVCDRCNNLWAATATPTA